MPCCLTSSIALTTAYFFVRLVILLFELEIEQSKVDIQFFYMGSFSLALSCVPVIVSITRVVFVQSLRKIHLGLRGELQMR